MHWGLQWDNLAWLRTKRKPGEPKLGQKMRTEIQEQRPEVQPVIGGVAPQDWRSLTPRGPRPQCVWGHSVGPVLGSAQALSVCGRTAGGKGAAWQYGDGLLTGHVFLPGPGQYQRARRSWSVGPMRVSQKHCFEMVEETSNHSLAKKCKGLPGEEAS